MNKTFYGFFNCVLLLFATVTYAGEAKQSQADDWEKILARARQDGKVTLGTNLGIPEFRQGVTTAFSKRFGFTVELRVLEGAELIAVAGRECAAGRPSMDVLLGGMSELITLYPKGCLSPLKPRLLLPEVAEAKNWRGGFLKYNDPDGRYLLQTAEFASFGRLLFNTDQMKPQEIRTTADLLKPKFKGKIAGFDPRVSGAGQATAAYLLTVFGENYIRKLYLDQGMVYSTNHRQLSEWVARGTYSIALGVQERGFEPLLKEGLPIKVLNSLDDAPGYLLGGSSVLKIMKDTPHPDGGIILANWLASKEGQEIYSRTVQQPSRRADVQSDEVPLYIYPKPGVKYLDTYSIEFYTKKRPEVMKVLEKLLGR
ncbi:MAG TPA: extracellular solute-binding protein [Methylomirabilota bacterium]|nr:extracellular solute-binding protein [Methylomirabilota bacterium]